jgi:hypothetical protein
MSRMLSFGSMAREVLIEPSDNQDSKPKDMENSKR